MSKIKPVVLIKTCFFRSDEGKCGDSEIYRFNPHVEKTGKCAFNPDSPAFMDRKLLCVEFRPDRNERKLPSKKRIDELVKEALDTKDYDRAAKIMIYYSLSKIDPKKFAQGFAKIAKLYEDTGGDIKPDDSRIQKIIDEVLDL